jgi:hypothetical protein
MKLGQETGGDNNSRVNEARAIVGMLEDRMEQLNPTEASFVERMAEADFVSRKQIFWLRDIKEKYL